MQDSNRDKTGTNFRSQLTQYYFHSRCSPVLWQADRLLVIPMRRKRIGGHVAASKRIVRLADFQIVLRQWPLLRHIWKFKAGYSLSWCSWV